MTAGQTNNLVGFVLHVFCFVLPLCCQLVVLHALILAIDLQRALMLSNDVFFKNHVVIIDTLLAGIGPTCRGYPWCRPQ